jgi:hypothetical protein
VPASAKGGLIRVMDDSWNPESVLRYKTRNHAEEDSPEGMAGVEREGTGMEVVEVCVSLKVFR